MRESEVVALKATAGAIGRFVLFFPIRLAPLVSACDKPRSGSASTGLCSNSGANLDLAPSNHNTTGWPKGHLAQ